MSTSSSHSPYLQHVAALERRLSTDQALRQAVGGEFVAMGRLEHYLLRSCGLRDDHLVVDVGCGSGRLAAQLAPFPSIRYIGCDVVPRLLDYARDLCGRPDWDFVHTDGGRIACANDEADFVCFFSVFTHLVYEDVYRYFREAHRMLKPGGVMVMSFLEFGVPAHWSTFLASVDRLSENQHLDQFIAPESIRAWAAHTGFDVRAIHAGNTAYIPLPEEILHESGERMIDAGSLGQSVAILQKRKTARVDMTGGMADRGPLAPESAPAVVTPSASPISAPAAPALLNVSTRARLLSGGALTAGFVIGGSATRRVLVRAIGPTLNRFGVASPIASPQLEIYSGQGLCAGGLMAWGGDADMAAIFAAVGAFALPAGSKDAAVLLTLPPGAYSMVIKGATALDEGEVLLEVYLVD